MKHTLNFLSLSALIILAACGKKEKNTDIPATGEQIPVKVVALNKQAGNNTVQASGQFTTDDETYLSFLTGGIVKQLFAKEGDRVRKGQLLATLDLTSINAMVNQAKLGLEKAKRDYERATNLQKEGFATLEQVQNAQTAVEIAEQQLASARFNLKYSEIRAVEDLCAEAARGTSRPGNAPEEATQILPVPGPPYWPRSWRNRESR